MLGLKKIVGGSSGRVRVNQRPNMPFAELMAVAGALLP
jgi:hypothetical protein